MDNHQESVIKKALKASPYNKAQGFKFAAKQLDLSVAQVARHYYRYMANPENSTPSSKTAGAKKIVGKKAVVTRVNYSSLTLQNANLKTVFKLLKTLPYDIEISGDLTLNHK